MGEPADEEIIHRTLDTEMPEPVVQIAEVVADLEDKEHDDLTPAYKHLDHVLTYVFTTPPVPEAQVQITFSYEGYRITVDQDGSAQFVKIE